MWLEQFFKDPIILRLFTFPVLTVVGTITLRFFIKDKFKIAGIFLIIYSVFMIIFFNKDFFIYVILYTIISLLAFIGMNKLEDIEK